MTTFLLIRHGLHVLGGGTIAGRLPGVDLSPDGLKQADGLVERLDGVPIAAIYGNPIDRALQTAQPLATSRGLAVVVCDDLQEIDYGDWTGAAIEDLRTEERWKEWNSFRSGHRVPNGESMLAVQARIVSLLMDLRTRHPHDCIALFSHGDVIKSAVSHCLGVPMDLALRIEISTASITAILVADYGPYVLCVNNTATMTELVPLMAND